MNKLVSIVISVYNVEEYIEWIYLGEGGSFA